MECRTAPCLLAWSASLDGERKVDYATFCAEWPLHGHRPTRSRESRSERKGRHISRTELRNTAEGKRGSPKLVRA